jgi:hypothetical protein
MPALSEFLSSFTTDLARPSRFIVNINIPRLISGPGSGSYSARQQLSLRCENANLPGRTFATMEQKNYGPVQKYPYLTTYSDMDLTFIVAGNMGERYLFDDWINTINSTYTNNFYYKSEYATSILINQLDVSNKITYCVELINAYPISMNQLDLDWSTDGYHKLVVTFAYDYWERVSRVQYPDSVTFASSAQDLRQTISDLFAPSAPQQRNSDLSAIDPTVGVTVNA